MDITHGLVAPPQWAGFVGTAGRVFVYAAIFFFLVCTVGFIANRQPPLSRLAARSFTLGCISIFGAMASLGTLMVQQQFQYQFVFDHTDRTTTIPYRIAAIWSGQEGSFLLWATCSALIGLFAVRHTAELRRAFTATYSLFLGAIAAILAYETPFRVALIEGKLLMPPTGNGLTPALRNYWVIIHPPTIFLGFGALTVLYAWSLASLANRDLDRWIVPVRPWIIITSTLIGVGLCMGGFWAYETLGWGGFWAWDPVENTSFVPWILTLAMLHGVFLQVARGTGKVANAVLAASGFVAFAYGTFLTRSGFMGDASVHSFAQMDRSALRLLVGLVLASIVGFAIMLIRYVRGAKPIESEPKKPEHALNLARGYRWGTWLLVAMAITTAIGMSVPVISVLLNAQQKTVEPVLYNQMLTWFFVPIAILMAASPFLSWRGLGRSEFFARFVHSVSLSLALTALIIFFHKRLPTQFRPTADDFVAFPFGIHVSPEPWVYFLSWVCLLGISANIWRLGETFKRSRSGIGGFVSHIGALTIVLGLIVSNGLERKQQFFLKQGEPSQVMGYTAEIGKETGDLFEESNKMPVTLKGDLGNETLSPTLYYVQMPGREPQSVAWPSIRVRPLYDLYLALGEHTFEVGQPTSVPVGKTIKVEDYEFKYREFKREGEAGQIGTKFGALIDAKAPDGTVQTIFPKMGVGGAEGPQFETVEVGPYMVAMRGMDAGTKAATLEFFYKQPYHAAELYFKPLTILVWGGTGIMTLGGIIAAIARRRTSKSVEAGQSINAADSIPFNDNSEQNTNAPSPVA